MSRGVLAIFGDLRRDSLETIKSYTNFYEIPYITWSFLNQITTATPTYTNDSNDKPDYLRYRNRLIGHFKKKYLF